MQLYLSVITRVIGLLKFQFRLAGITAIDYAEIVAAYLHNYLPKDFYHKYGISLGDFDQETLWKESLWKE